MKCCLSSLSIVVHVRVLHVLLYSMLRVLHVLLYYTLLVLHVLLYYTLRVLHDTGDCPAGTYWSGTQCAACAKGFYQDKEDKGSCVACLAGHTTYLPSPTLGADSLDDCFGRHLSSACLVD